MQTKLGIVVVICALSLASCDHDFSAYAFSAILNTEEDGGLYELYWTFDNDAETIDFAVRVQTNGWVGFGLSPNGQMPNSDVVMGWVTNGEVVYNDRHAPLRAPPVIDESQDWILKSGEEEGEFTILEFSRNYSTCDDNDLPITAETARVIWGFNDVDPASEELTFADFHSHQGSISLNLLGGLPSTPPEPNDVQTYDVNVDSIVIPEADTTYWCAAFRLPEEIRSQTKYVTKFGPILSEGNEAFVHHFLVYLCDGLDDTHVGNGGPCEGDDVANEVKECRGGTLIAAWAVGGEDFYYPENVAYPFGGAESSEYLVMELHYDNPSMLQGTVDSSGMRIWYTSTPREHDAGIFEVGHSVTSLMVIPPNVDNFTTTGIVPSECTSLLPVDGIHVFANILHTHEIGHGLVLQHFRLNSECDVYEELEPIDRNLQYDFNFQQINHLRREVTIMPGDVLQLKCFYRTPGADNVTLGGLSTRDEMCLSFLAYYPRISATVALSQISYPEYLAYLSTFESGRQILSGEISYDEGLNAVNWDETAINNLQTTYDQSVQQFYCGGGGAIDRDNGLQGETNFLENRCPYIAPDQCTDFTPPTCCERIREDGGVILRASLALLLVASLLATIMK